MEIASIFTDRMVLQQGVPIPIWGHADPGQILSICFASQKVLAEADTMGRWRAELSPQEASSIPARLEAICSNGQERVFEDVLVGEVWVCSGQSNMQWPVGESSDSVREIQGAIHPAIRLFTVPPRPSALPRENVGAAGWQICNPQTVADFSAVGYFFGRELHRKLGVPIGLVNASVGGTFAESWTSREGLFGHDSLRGIVQNFERDLPGFSERKRAWEQEMAALEARTTDSENTGVLQHWEAEADPQGTWAEMELPGSWQSRGLSHSGVLWFRKVIDLPAEWSGRDLQLSLGAADKSDTTYFNGEPVGGVTMAERSDAWSLPRVYTVPGRLVKPGRNVIEVRVHSEKYAGGLTGPATLMNLSLLGANKAASFPLAGKWRYTVEADYGLVSLPEEPISPVHQNAPCTLFNGMIAPLVPYAIRGAIWYQGEANADYMVLPQDGETMSRAERYQVLFPVLIKDWRCAWGQGDFPFYFVQLANFKARLKEPAESAWAELREAQAMALALPHTGMAVAIDVGEADDIHPGNKQAVGGRLASQALHRTYGRREMTPSGPVFRSVVRNGTALRCTFDSWADRLICRGDELRGFAIAGENGQFVWALARIEGSEVILSHPQIPFPQSIRYGWADNPAVGLFNSAGLPAAPFRAECSF